MKAWLYPGSFDPVTLGHTDIIRRAAVQCDKLYVAVLKNDAKRGTFSLEERCAFLRRCTASLPNVEVISFGGLTVDLLQKLGACAIVRGLRNTNDFVFEQQIAAVNQGLSPLAETVLLMTSPLTAHISSSMVLSVGLHGGSLAGLVPDEILQDINLKLSQPVNRGI